jgi:hypothetical protein
MKSKNKFSIDSFKKVRVTAIEVDSEKDGEAYVAKLDIHISYSTSNEVLSELHPSLRDLIYRTADESEGDLADQGQPMTMLRFPEMSGFTYTVELHDYEASIAVGIDANKVIGVAIELEGVTTKKITVMPRDGGTVALMFKMRFNLTPNTNIADMLAQYLKQECYLRFTPTKASDQPLFEAPKDAKPKRAVDELATDGNGGFKTVTSHLPAKVAKAAAKKTAAKKAPAAKKAAAKKVPKTATGETVQ